LWGEVKKSRDYPPAMPGGGERVGNENRSNPTPPPNMGKIHEGKKTKERGKNRR